MSPVLGCHLVGSVPLPTTESVFRQVLSALPHRLKRIPDGEPGLRNNFTTFQATVFSVYPPMMTKFSHNAPIPADTFTPEQIDEGISILEKANIETGYDTAAIESYSIFKKLRDEGVIPKSGVRFQVCIPLVANVITPFVQFPFQRRVEPIYEAALFRAIQKIQSVIPHEDLAIQIDLAVDTAFWQATDPSSRKEDSGLEWFRPWWEGDVKGYITGYVNRMLGQIGEGVEVGLHNCYGDMDHRHWHEPNSLAMVVERHIRITQALSSPRKINYIHMPVPKSALSRPDVGLDKYLTPLRELQPVLEQHGTELYLGVVHEHQPELTKQMIEAVERVVPGLKFGVAMECGGGRMSWGSFEDALGIAREVSGEVV